MDVKAEEEEEEDELDAGRLGRATSSGDGDQSRGASAQQPGKAPQQGLSVPGSRLRTMLNGGPPQRSAQEPEPTPVGRRDTEAAVRPRQGFEAAATPAALLGAGLVVDSKQPLLGAGLMPVRTKREDDDRGVQFRETNSCFSGGGTKTLEGMSDHKRTPRHPRKSGDRKSGDRSRQRSAGAEAAQGHEISSGSEKVGGVFQKIYEDLAGSGA